MTTDDLDTLTDHELRLRALPLMGWRRYTFGPGMARSVDGMAWIDHHDPEQKVMPYGGGLAVVECGDDLPLYPDAFRSSVIPNPVHKIMDAFELVEAVWKAGKGADLYVMRPDGPGYTVGFEAYGTLAHATAPTLPRALTILALRSTTTEAAR